MKIIVTCGPSFEPIDEVRRLTNFSTGELGVLLANRLAEHGHEVICLKGSGATFPGPGTPCRTHLFDTNDNLLAELKKQAASKEIGAVFHVAALCDYRIKQVQDETGQTCDSPKIASRSGALTLQLEPATKVIHRLRPLFPNATLVGWKYELAGTREDALAKARRQLTESATDACVVNGRAFGAGFGLLGKDGSLAECRTKQEVVDLLANWLAK